jgi:hypothetical protein
MPRRQVHVFSAAHNLELVENPEGIRARVRGSYSLISGPILLTAGLQLLPSYRKPGDGRARGASVLSE